MIKNNGSRSKFILSTLSANNEILVGYFIYGTENKIEHILYDEKNFPLKRNIYIMWEKVYDKIYKKQKEDVIKFFEEM